MSASTGRDLARSSALACLNEALWRRFVTSCHAYAYRDGRVSRYLVRVLGRCLFLLPWDLASRYREVAQNLVKARGSVSHLRRF